jgi:hypothetical protein
MRLLKSQFCMAVVFTLMSTFVSPVAANAPAIADAVATNAVPTDVHLSMQPGELFRPYIVAIPGSGLNNAALIVSAGGVDNVQSALYAAADQGSTSHMRSHTLEYHPGTKTYRHTFDGFFADAGQISGSIEITASVSATQTVSSGRQAYERWPIYRSMFNQVVFRENNRPVLEMLLDAETLPADLAYLLIMNSGGLPAPPPPNHVLISPAYSVQASGALDRAERNFLLIFRYTPSMLGSLDPSKLAVYHYDPVEQWQRQEGELYPEQGEVHLATQLFGIYILLAESPPATYLPVIMHNKSE